MQFKVQGDNKKKLCIEQRSENGYEFYCPAFHFTAPCTSAFNCAGMSFKCYEVPSRAFAFNGSEYEFCDKAHLTNCKAKRQTRFFISKLVGNSLHFILQLYQSFIHSLFMYILLKRAYLVLIMI